MLRIFLIGCVALFTSAIFSSCKKPNYSNVPEIELVSFQKITNFESNNGADSLVFIFKFKDGDADIGLDDNDVPVEELRPLTDGIGNKIIFDYNNPNQKFNCLDWDKTDSTKIQSNRNYHNLFLEIDKKINGVYVKQDNSCIGIRAYRFQRLAPVNYTGPLDVKFTYYKTLNLISEASDLASMVLQFKTNDIIRFRIRITDRKLNVSNEVVTQDVKI